jgi:hypothetical protein
LEINTDEVHQRCVVSAIDRSDGQGKGWVDWAAYTSIFVVEQAIISFMAIRNRPPVSEGNNFISK